MIAMSTDFFIHYSHKWLFYSRAVASIGYRWLLYSNIIVVAYDRFAENLIHNYQSGKGETRGKHNLT